MKFINRVVSHLSGCPGCPGIGSFVFLRLTISAIAGWWPGSSGGVPTGARGKDDSGQHNATESLAAGDYRGGNVKPPKIWLTKKLQK